VKCNGPADGHTTECHFNVRKQQDLAQQVVNHVVPLAGPADGLYRAFTARQGSARVGLCAEHARELRRRAWGGTFLIVLGLTLPFVTFLLPDSDTWFALVLVPIGFFIGMSSASPVSAVRIEDGRIWIVGAAPVFLDSLPQLDPSVTGVEPIGDDGPL
jgi:hypothetical protein